MGWNMRVRIVAVLLAVAIAQPAGIAYAQNSGAQRHTGIHKRVVAPSEAEARGHAELVRLLRKKVKYVFVIYQENRSFDSYFGTFPGANGIFSKDARHTPGFNQQIIDTDGTVGTIHPFRIGPDAKPCGRVSACFAADTDDVDHSHPSILAKIDRHDGLAKMDRFALTEERKYSPTGNPSLQAKQFGELAMAYEDCDTVPLLWQYAHKFVLFDHIFQEMAGPSTPGNLSILGAQTGVTQWVLHPDEAYAGNGASGQGVPVLNDGDPFWGSQLDKTPQSQKMPVNPHDFRNGKEYATQRNLTYATLPLTLAGGDLGDVTKSDRDADDDLGDVKEDVGFITALKKASVPFGWYEEGYDKEPTDPDEGPTDANGVHASYVTHHNGPQYFGYISNNPKMNEQLHGLDDFFEAVEKQTLPKQGGLFFIKGGFRNIFGMHPVDPDPNVQKSFLGDDDHPSYSDAQISEAMAAEAINKIAASSYWAESAIIITWDDSEGDYDHVPPPVRAYGPDGSPISDGPRVPLLLISPYARTGFIAHDEGSHASVAKFVDALFNLTPLALLPDELHARKLGEIKFHQKGLGPQDALTPGVTDLTAAFSRNRLDGKQKPLPPSYVEVPEDHIRNLPLTTGFGCKNIGIVPTDRFRGLRNVIPSDFNPRPRTNRTAQ
ncbi:MAG: phospholipase C [Candidatus Acidiferrales bacterium]